MAANTIRWEISRTLLELRKGTAMNFKAGLLLMTLAGFAPVPAAAAPYLPADDGEALERLPSRTGLEFRELDRLRAEAAARPGDAATAAALADGYYRISRREGDPRYLGYAQAALAPWWQAADAPTPVLVVRATILQSSHRFGQALADLGAAIAREPANARAILVRSSIRTVMGDYPQARADCARLLGLVQDLYVLTCAAGIESVNGNAAAARSALEQAFADAPGASADVRGLIASLLGEITARQGDSVAESHFKAALAADPRDLYTLAAYCDWLLDAGRPADVIPLVENEQRIDGMLLRLALAEQALGRATAAATIATLSARFDASRARGDTVHRREEARFQLVLNHDVAAALRLAAANWQVQREPADLRILAEAARAADDAAARAVVRQWLTATKLDYPAIAELVK